MAKSIEDIRIDQGTEFPYSYRGRRRKPITDPAELAAVGVLADLGDRRGIKWELEGIEHDSPDVAREILIRLTRIIRRAYERMPATEAGRAALRAQGEVE